MHTALFEDKNCYLIPTACQNKACCALNLQRIKLKARIACSSYFKVTKELFVIQ